jgi:ribosome-binding factor A
MSQRTDRVDELLRQEIGAILTRDLEDPRVGFATITDVETTPDLRHARVWVSVIGGEEDRAATVAALTGAMGFVRRELGRRLRLKRIPELHLRLDESSERGTRVLRLLSELEEGLVPDEPPVGETLPTPVPRLRRVGDADDEPGDAEETGDIGGGSAPQALPPSGEPGRPTRTRRQPRVRRARASRR